MAIKRDEDGELREEPIRPARARRRGSEAEPEPATRPLRTERADAGDSLFGPDRRRGEDGSLRDEPIKPLRRRSEQQTRILTPLGRDAAHAREDPMADPPVGWLVIIRGPGKGRALTLGNGMNAIGRGANARLRVDFGDDGISRENHARIAYDPRRRCFLLSHGEGVNLTYLDGEVVMQTQPIESGAEIRIGDTVMRFQAFCSEQFDWPDADD